MEKVPQSGALLSGTTVFLTRLRVSDGTRRMNPSSTTKRSDTALLWVNDSCRTPRGAMSVEGTWSGTRGGWVRQAHREGRSNRSAPGPAHWRWNGRTQCPQCSCRGCRRMQLCRRLRSAAGARCCAPRGCAGSRRLAPRTRSAAAERCKWASETSVREQTRSLKRNEVDCLLSIRKMKMQRDVKLCCSADVIVRQQSTTSLYGPAGLCNAQEPGQAAAADCCAPSVIELFKCSRH